MTTLFKSQSRPRIKNFSPELDTSKPLVEEIERFRQLEDRNFDFDRVLHGHYRASRILAEELLKAEEQFRAEAPEGTNVDAELAHVQSLSIHSGNKRPDTMEYLRIHWDKSSPLAAAKSNYIHAYEMAHKTCMAERRAMRLS